MKPNLKQILLFQTLALCVGILTLPAGAAPLKRADVKADPSLVVHIDFDGLRSTQVGKAILNQLSQPDIDAKITALDGFFGFDPRTQLHGATLFATSQTPPEGVLIVYADFDPNRVLALAKMASGFHTITNGTHIIHTWIDDKGKNKDKDKDADNDNDKDGDSPHIFGAIKGNRILLSKSESSLNTELDLLDGTGHSLAGQKTMPELGAGDKGTVIQAVVSRFDFGNSDPNAAILKMSKLVKFQVGEKGDYLAANLSFEAQDENVATQISAIAQGLLALLKLQHGDTNILKIANAVAVRQDQAIVTATASVLSKDVEDLIKTKVAAAEEEHSSDTNASTSK